MPVQCCNSGTQYRASIGSELGSSPVMPHPPDDPPPAETGRRPSLNNGRAATAELDVAGLDTLLSAAVPSQHASLSCLAQDRPPHRSAGPLAMMHTCHEKAAELESQSTDEVATSSVPVVTFARRVSDDSQGEVQGPGVTHSRRVSNDSQDESLTSPTAGVAHFPSMATRSWIGSATMFPRGTAHDMAKSFITDAVDMASRTVMPPDRVKSEKDTANLRVTLAVAEVASAFFQQVKDKIHPGLKVLEDLEETDVLEWEQVCILRDMSRTLERLQDTLDRVVPPDTGHSDGSAALSDGLQKDASADCGQRLYFPEGFTGTSIEDAVRSSMQKIDARWRWCLQCNKATQHWESHMQKCKEQPEDGLMESRELLPADVIGQIADIHDRPFIKAYTCESPLCYDGNKATREVALKNREPTDDEAWLQYRPFEYGLTCELMKEPRWEGVCFRAVDFKVEWAPGYLTTWPQISSAARNPRVVRAFLDNSSSDVGQGPAGTIFMIKARSCRSIEQWSIAKFEKEVTFLINSQFRRCAVVGEGVKHLMASALRVKLGRVLLVEAQEVRLAVWADLMTALSMEESARNHQLFRILQEDGAKKGEGAKDFITGEFIPGKAMNTIPELTDGSRNTILHLACGIPNNHAVVQTMLCRKPFVDAKNSEGLTAMDNAIRSGDLLSAKVLLVCGAEMVGTPGEPVPRGLDLRNTRLQTCRFRGADLSLQDPDFLESATLTDRSCFESVTAPPNWNLRRRNLRGADLRNADLSKGVNFSRAKLTHASFSFAKMPPNLDLRNLQLQGCNFMSVDFSKGVQFQGSDLKNAAFGGVDVIRPECGDPAVLHPDAVKKYGDTKCIRVGEIGKIDNDSHRQYHVQGPQGHLDWFLYSDIQDLSTYYRNFKGPKHLLIEGCSKINVMHLLRGAAVFAPDADLRGLDLTGCDFRQVDFSAGLQIEGSRLTDAKFEHAKFPTDFQFPGGQQVPIKPRRGRTFDAATGRSKKEAGAMGPRSSTTDVLDGIGIRTSSETFTMGARNTSVESQGSPEKEPATSKRDSRI